MCQKGNKVLDIVGKPDDYHMCKALNVYDDRYRVNVFVREDVEDLTGHKLYIDKSYLGKDFILNGNKLGYYTIILSNKWDNEIY